MSGQSGDYASDHTRHRGGRIILALITAGGVLVLGASGSGSPRLGPQPVQRGARRSPHAGRPALGKQLAGRPSHRRGYCQFATHGALMQSVSVAGRPGTSRIGVENGHPVYTVDLELPRGTSRTIVLHLIEPVAIGTPIVRTQPLVRPLQVALHDAVSS